MISRDAVQFVSSPFLEEVFRFFPLNFTSTGSFCEKILFFMVHCFFLLWKIKEASLFFLLPLLQLLKQQGALKPDASLGCLGFLKK